MADDAPGQSPEAVAVRAEVGKIMTDASHPLHAGSKASSGPAFEAYDKHVKGLYDKLPGAGEKVDITGGDVKTPPPDQTDDAGAASEFLVANAAVLSTQRQAWEAKGESYDNNMALITSYATEHFGTKPGMLEGIMDAILKQGMNPAEINQKILEMARQARGGTKV